MATARRFQFSGTQVPQPVAEQLLDFLLRRSATRLLVVPPARKTASLLVQLNKLQTIEARLMSSAKPLPLMRRRSRAEKTGLRRWATQ